VNDLVVKADDLHRVYQYLACHLELGLPYDITSRGSGLKNLSPLKVHWAVSKTLWDRV